MADGTYVIVHSNPCYCTQVSSSLNIMKYVVCLYLFMSPSIHKKDNCIKMNIIIIIKESIKHVWPLDLLS